MSVLNKYFDRLKAGDREALKELFVGGAVVSFKGMGDYSGASSIGEFVRDLFASFPIFTPVKLTVVESGSEAGVECIANGRVATGKEFHEVGFAHFFTFKGDRVSSLTVYADMPGLRAQVGKW